MDGGALVGGVKSDGLVKVCLVLIALRVITVTEIPCRLQG